MQIIVDNLLINYSVKGSSSDTILLIHGWGSSMEPFKVLSEELSSSYKVVSLDLPGMGNSQAPPAPWTLDDYCNLISDFLYKLKIKSLYSIIGHSNGGSIAIKMISNGLVETKGLILLGSAGIRDSKKLKKQTIKYVAKTGKQLLKFGPKSVQNKLKKELYKSVGSQALDNPLLEETFKNVVSEDIQSAANDITEPTLLIYGRDDGDTPPEYGKILNEAIKNSRLYIIEEAGHYVFIDKPQKVVRLINEFLKLNKNP